jgi:hypothetical protein
MLGGACVAVLLAACTSGHHAQPPTSLPTATSSPTATTCMVTTARPGTAPPSVIHPAEPQPVPWITSFAGNQVLWVGLPADSTLHSDTLRPPPFMVKFPWWRLKTGQLTITARRLDGPGAGFDAKPGSVYAYGDTGFVPSELSFPLPGCWKITGSVHGGSLSITLRVA